MQDTINFLKVLDSPIALPRSQGQSRHRYKSEGRSANGSTLRPHKISGSTHSNNNSIISNMQGSKNYHRRVDSESINYDKFQYSRGLHFSEQKLKMFPNWLKSRHDFVEFIYSNYEKKILALPKICEKEPKQRTSDELYFLSMYLSQIDMFKKLPYSIQEIILKNISTKYFKKGEVIHRGFDEPVDFMAVVFLGEVEIEPQQSSGSHTTFTINTTRRGIVKGKNSVILKKCFYGKSETMVTALQQVILLTLSKSVYNLIQNQLSIQIKDKYKDDMDDLPKSDLFMQLHIKDKRYKQFVADLKLQFYFKDQTIAECGEQSDMFYIVLSGGVRRKNHIYIREHNKWPLPRKRWEIRAVYKTYQNESKLEKYHFFGDQEMFSDSKLKATYITTEHSIILTMGKTQFCLHINGEDQKKLKKYRNEHMAVNYPQFQKEIRKKKRDMEYKKGIIHQAIDVSFCNKTTLPELETTKRKMGKYEKHMLAHIEQILGKQIIAPTV